jgi:hypothetical protein
MLSTRGIQHYAGSERIIILKNMVNVEISLRLFGTFDNSVRSLKITPGTSVRVLMASIPRGEFRRVSRITDIWVSLLIRPGFK